MQLAQHIRFIDSDDEDISKSNGMQLETAPAGPSRTAPIAPSARSNFSLLSTISTDYDQKDQCYVLHLAHSPATGTVAAALSNRQIKLYNLKDGGLQFTGSLSGHTGTITSAQCPLLDEPHVLQTTSADGTVREWDLRSGQAARVFTAGNQEISCCTSNGSLLAAGARDNVLFWDRGTGKHISNFTDTHFQDVTQVKFHPVTRSAFISGSEDGLIAVFDTAGGLDEDEGFRAALNIDTAVAKIGFYGGGGKGDKLWCCSGTETLHLWEWAAACDDESQGGNGPLGQSLDARTKLSLDFAGNGAGGSNGQQELGSTNAADYLIQCEYDPSNDELAVIAGNNTGTAALFPIVQPPHGATDVNLEFRPAVAVLQGGHSDVVRSLSWVNGTGPLWVSGGEDARVCVWSSIPGAVGPTPQPSSVSGGSSGGDSAARQRMQQTHMRRASPY
jgi:WD40 repeat protein